MLNLTAVLETTVNVPFIYKEDTVNCVVYLERATPALRQELADAAEKRDDDAVRLLVSRLIKSWDVVADDEPFPPTFENTLLLPYAFLIKAAEAVMSLWQGNPTTASGSPTTSEPVDKKEASPAGTTSSEPPAISE